ncbi:MAG: phosphoribosylglycinamide formyltransferase [Anaerolineae bacterium]|nr:phosphoribosylglycinamide formyltransferase [Anaerolineae bacterium]
MSSPDALIPLAVLVSGHGSNLQAILDACAAGRLPARVAVVVSNRREAYGLERARQAGVPALYHPLKPYTSGGRSRAEYDADLANLLQPYKPAWVVLAGWMHVLSHAFLHHYPNRVVNLHPALPGQFPGVEAIARAHAAYQNGEIEGTGVMVHLVPDEAVDAGPVVATAPVLILPTDTLADLEARVHQTEHELLVSALLSLLSGKG